MKKGELMSDFFSRRTTLNACLCQTKFLRNPSSRSAVFQKVRKNLRSFLSTGKLDARESLSLTELALETSNNELSHLDILSEREPKTIGALEAIKITQRRVEHRPFRHYLAKKRFVMCVAHCTAHPHCSQ